MESATTDPYSLSDATIKIPILPSLTRPDVSKGPPGPKTKVRLPKPIVGRLISFQLPRLQYIRSTQCKIYHSNPHNGCLAWKEKEGGATTMYTFARLLASNSDDQLLSGKECRRRKPVFFKPSNRPLLIPNGRHTPSLLGPPPSGLEKIDMRLGFGRYIPNHCNELSPGLFGPLEVA